MNSLRVRVYLVVLILTLLPMAGGYYSVRSVVKSSLAIGLDPQIASELHDSGRYLKNLARLDPSHSQDYKKQFEALQENLKRYESLLELRPSLAGSLE